METLNKDVSVQLRALHNTNTTIQMLHYWGSAAQASSNVRRRRALISALEALRLQEFCDILEVLNSKRPRERRDMKRDVSACYERVMRLPRDSFFEQLRMEKSTFLELAGLTEPYFERDPSTRGPKDRKSVV